MSIKTLLKFAAGFGLLAIVLIFLGVNFVPRIKAFSLANGNTVDASLRDLSTARWQALGDYYSKYSATIPNFDASLRDLSAARWQALGDYYSKYSATIPNFDALLRDLSATRWQALGNYYSNYSATVPNFNSSLRDLSAARWQALGESYLTVNPAEGTSGGCNTLSGYARKYLKAACPAP